MYREDADGSAVVWGVPVAPFVPVQHMQVDVTAVNLIGNYCFRLARERGWLQTAQEMALAASHTLSTESPPAVQREAVANAGADNTFFFAGVEEALADPRPHFTAAPTPSTLLAAGRFHLVHVGSSSYGVCCILSTYRDGEAEAAWRLLGTFKVTTVWVSKLRRTPTPLLEDKQSLFQAVMARAASGTPPPPGSTRVQRLPVADLLRRSGWFAEASAVAAVDVAPYCTASAPPPPEEFTVAPPATNSASTASSAPLWLLHRRSFTLRESDIDFNLHLNQLVTKQLVINAFRGAVADPQSAYSRLLHPDVPHNRADLLLRKFRIDYVREVPMRYAATEVFLFPLDPARVKAQVSSAGGATAAEADMMEIGFFTLGVPPAHTTESRFLATAGVMTAVTCFMR
ncbi:hypothetical protein NESM_000925100 [Novymonas esmeraldas]|uniref:Uncharacterized protein n=1 Tax=Novymonas esmeraldas TaxID=1808958 RepID=A0AAW0F0S8_9TRYP